MSGTDSTLKVMTQFTYEIRVCPSSTTPAHHGCYRRPRSATYSVSSDRGRKFSRNCFLFSISESVRFFHDRYFAFDQNVLFSVLVTAIVLYAVAEYTHISCIILMQWSSSRVLCIRRCRFSTASTPPIKVNYIFSLINYISFCPILIHIWFGNIRQSVYLKSCTVNDRSQSL